MIIDDNLLCSYWYTLFSGVNLAEYEDHACIGYDNHQNSNRINYLKPELPQGNNKLFQFVHSLRLLENNENFRNSYTYGIRINYPNTYTREIFFDPSILPPQNNQNFNRQNPNSFNAINPVHRNPEIPMPQNRPNSLNQNIIIIPPASKSFIQIMLIHHQVHLHIYLQNQKDQMFL